MASLASPPPANTLSRCLALAAANHTLAAAQLLLALPEAEREATLAADPAPPALREVLLRGQQLLAVAESLRSREGWKLVSQAAGVDTLLQMDEGSPLAKVRVEGVIDAPLPHVFALLNEFALWPDFLPGVTSAGRLENMSPIGDLVQLLVWLPFPIASREAALRVHGGFLREGGGEAGGEEAGGEDTANELASRGGTSLIIHCADAPADDPLLPAVPGGGVRASVQTGGFQLFSIDGGRKTLLKLVLTVDIKMAAMPYWLLNFVVKHVRTREEEGRGDGESGRTRTGEREREREEGIGRRGRGRGRERERGRTSGTCCVDTLPNALYSSLSPHRDLVRSSV